MAWPLPKPLTIFERLELIGERALAEHLRAQELRLVTLEARVRDLETRMHRLTERTVSQRVYGAGPAAQGLQHTRPVFPERIDPKPSGERCESEGLERLLGSSEDGAQAPQG